MKQINIEINEQNFRKNLSILWKLQLMIQNQSKKQKNNEKNLMIEEISQIEEFIINSYAENLELRREVEALIQHRVWLNDFMGVM